MAARVPGLPLLLGLCASLAACQSPPVAPESVAEVVAPETVDERFSRDRAWRHLLALTDVGPRVAGTDGAARARQYIRARLEELGVEVRERRSQVFVESRDEAVELVHLTGVITGESSDVFMLVASYDTPPLASVAFVGADDGASGPALLLELARVLVSRSLPYTVSLTFLDGEALAPDVRDSEPAMLGSRDLASQLVDEGAMSRLRLAVFFHQVADPDLEIVRDLRSHQVYREIFWQAAQSLGHVAAFPGDRGFSSPALGHLSFLDRGLRRVVVIADDHFGDEDGPWGAPGRAGRDTPECCSAESLDVVAEVTLEALALIGARLKKIDRFASSPLDDLTRGVPGPEDAERVGEDNLDGREPETRMHGETNPTPTASQPPASP